MKSHTSSEHVGTPAESIQRVRRSIRRDGNRKPTKFESKILAMAAAGMVQVGRIITTSEGFVVEYVSGRRLQFAQQYTWPGNAGGHTRAAQTLAKTHFGGGVLWADVSCERPSAGLAAWGFTTPAFEGASTVACTHFVVFAKPV